MLNMELNKIRKLNFTRKYAEFDLMHILILCFWVISFTLQVNNAGVNFNLGSDNSVENARKVIETNYYGTKRMTEAIISLMKPSLVGARIVNVSSRLGRLNGRRNVSKALYTVS